MSNIPKIIHYCWFGEGKKPKLIGDCISTWKKYLPEYNIVEWNENNFKVEDFNFAYKAYNDRKWAFVSDYARLWALYNYGGIYLDTDMEILKPLDHLLINESFGGLEDEKIAFGIWGCKKGNKFIGEVLKRYNSLNYDDYKNNLFDLAIPIHLTKVARENGYKDDVNLINSDSMNSIVIGDSKKIEGYEEIYHSEDISDGEGGGKFNDKEIKYFLGNVAIYPKEYFYPKRHALQEPIITKNTYTIHHYEGSWRKPHQIFREKLKEKILKTIRYFKVKS